METLGNPGKMKLLLIPRDEKRLLKEFKKSYLKNKKEAEKTGISFDETIFPNI